MVFHFFSALAEFERELIRKRTRAGPARVRGKVDGRPQLLDKRDIAWLKNYTTNARIQ